MRGPGGKEEGPKGLPGLPSPLRTATPITWQAQGILRRQCPLRGGGWEQAHSLNICSSQRERQRLLGLDKQKETGIWQAPRLPLLSPGRNFLGGQKCAYHSLHASSSDATWPQVCPHQLPPMLPGLTSPLIQGASGATPPVLEFLLQVAAPGVHKGERTGKLPWDLGFPSGT